MTGYTDTIRRWAMDDRRCRPLPDADGIGEVGLGNGEKGRRLAVRFAIRVEKERVTTVRFEVFGCGFTIAACAAAADLVEGRSLAEALAVDAASIEVALEGLPTERDYCAMLAAKALQGAIASARDGSKTVQAGLSPDEDHDPQISADDPIYRRLIETPGSSGQPEEDRHLFACLFAVAAREPYGLSVALGLPRIDLEGIMATCFPGRELAEIEPAGSAPTEEAPEANRDVLGILLSHLPTDADGRFRPVSAWLAHILATRAAQPGHLWTAMGLFKRPELSAAIGRHLPSLAAANSLGMRWKRYLYKRVCDLGGGTMCQTPDCGECSDHALCFAPENQDGGTADRFAAESIGKS